MDAKTSAMQQITKIMDDGADKDDSQNSENSQEDCQGKQTGANAAAKEGEDAAGEDADEGRGRMARGGSVSVNDDTIFGEAALGRKRSNSIEATRPRVRQEHSNLFGSILENIQENLNFHDEARPGEEEDAGLESAPSQSTANDESANKVDSDMNLSGGEDQQDRDFFDELENMEIDDIDDIVSFADNAATRLAAETAKKLKKLMRSAKATQKSEQYIKEQRKKLLDGYNKKKGKLDRYLHSAPFTRTSDKATFVYGVLQLVVYVFILGRYENTFIYDYHCLKMTVLIAGKWLYYKSKGWHYYMTDLCYFVNLVVIIYLLYSPKNDTLFKIAFCFSNGCLATAVGAFKNQMVFHKMDNLTSLALHMVPQATLWNLRWNTMVSEQSLKPEDRRFVDLNTEFSFMKFFGWPLILYFSWFGVYFCINFVFAKERIARRKYDNMFKLYWNQGWSHKMLSSLGKDKVYIMFFIIHFSFFFSCHLVSILCFYYEYFHTFSVCFWLTWSIWNAANFYFNYFSKKYETSLAKLQEVQTDLEPEGSKIEKKNQ